MTAPTADLPTVDELGEVEEPFGPDATATAELPETPDADQKQRPRPVRDVLNNVGRNKTPKTSKGLRALVKDDRDKLAAYYAGLGAGIQTGAMMGFPMCREATGEALVDNAEACADAWIDLARKNDHVRRVVLFMVEGGALTKLFMAHTPIIMSMMPSEPPKWLERLLPKRAEPSTQDSPADSSR